MLKFKEYRKLLQKGVTESEARNGSAVDARHTFVEDFRLLLGITEDVNGNPRIAEGAMRPDEVNIPLLAEAIFGAEKMRETFYHDSSPDRRTILEAGPVDPSAMLNISTFSLAVGGLIDAQIIAKFNNPAFIGDRLVTTRPTNKNGEKMIGVNGSADEGKTRAPGKPHARTGLGNHYIQTPELEEKALAIDVTKEVVRYDLTGDVLNEASNIGFSLGYGREKTRLKLVNGGVNPYNRNGTGYNTYQTTTPWVNNQTNEFADLSDLENSKKLFRQMTDPDTGREILVEGWQILCSPDREITFDRVLNAYEVRETTNTNTVTIGGNPIKGRYEILSSQIEFNLRQAAAADGGLALSADNSNKRWYHGDFKKAFAWMEAEPLTTRQANAAEYLMMDHGLIASYFASYVGIGAVIAPQYVVVNTH